MRLHQRPASRRVRQRANRGETIQFLTAVRFVRGDEMTNKAQWIASYFAGLFFSLLLTPVLTLLFFSAASYMAVISWCKLTRLSASVLHYMAEIRLLSDHSFLEVFPHPLC